MRAIAKLISTVLHPLLIPTYGVALLLFTSYFTMNWYVKIKFILLAMTWIVTALIPFLFILLLRSMKRLTSLSLKNKEERFLPLLFGSFMCYANSLLLGKIPRLPYIFSGLFLALTLFLLLLAFISRFWKISLHMSALAGLLAVASSYSLHSEIPLFLVLCSGLLGSSRLLLKAHDSLQVYIGFCFGFLFFGGYFVLF